MSLQVWLPLNGNLNNQGLYNLSQINPSQNTFSYNTDGKIGSCTTGTCGWKLNEDILDNQWSVALWFKTTSAFGANNNILFCKNTSGSTDCQIYFSIINGSSLHIGVNGPSSSLSQSFTFNLNTWYHVAATYDGNKACLYINGVFQKSAIVTTAKPSDRLNIRINGRSTNAANTSQTGQLSGYNFNDFRLYNHALSVKEVEEIAKGLVLHYKLDNNGQGGRNILLGTNKKNFSTTANSANDRDKGQFSVGSGGNGTFSVTEELVPVGRYSYNVTNNTSGNRDFQQGHIPYIEGQKYTGSWWAKGSGTCLYRSWNRTAGSQVFSKTYTLTSDWTFYSYTFTATAAQSTDDCTFHLGVTGNSSIQIAGMKLELGDKATSYSQAPEDLGENVNIIYDSSGYQNNGDSTNISFISNTPQYNAAIQIHGTTVDNSSNTKVGSAYIRGFISLTTPSALTVTWWGKNTSYGRGGIFQTSINSDPSECTDYNTTAIANWDSTFRIYNGSTAVNFFNSFVKDDTWHYHTITFDGNTAKYYLDGSQKINSALTGTLPTFNGFCLGLGKAGGVYRQIKESISDFRIYVTALTAEQVKELYDTSATIDKNGNVYTREVQEI